MAGRAGFEPALKSSDELAAAPRADAPSAARRDARPGQQAHYGRRSRPSGAPAGPAPRLARPSAVPARPGQVPPVVYEVLRGPGAPLDARTRGLMESRLGTGLGHVRVHTDARASESADAVNSVAYTVGRSIVFGAGHYAPRDQAGQRLLAHELAHTVQQGRSGTPFTGQRLRLGPPASKAEGEAEMIEARRPTGERVAGGELHSHAAPVVQRKIKTNAYLIEDVNEESFTPGIERKVDELAERRRWPDEFPTEIMDRITAMIRAEETYPPEGQFSGYDALVESVAQQLVAERGAQLPQPGMRYAPLAPVPIRRNRSQSAPPSPADLPTIRRTGSELRVSSPTALHEEFRMGALRRAGHDTGALDPGFQQASLGQFSGWIRGHGDNVTEKRGGKALSYVELWEQFTQAIRKTNREAARDILAMLHGDPGLLLNYDQGALRALDHILTVLAVAEQARATSAALHFAAAINYVAEAQGGRLAGAFAGDTAVFLGANKGGAAALRGATPQGLLGQQNRAKSALTTYRGQYGQGMSDEEHLRGVMTNMAGYSRIRQGGPMVPQGGPARDPARAVAAAVAAILVIAAVLLEVARRAGVL
jgi:hypothetical protein